MIKEVTSDQDFENIIQNNPYVVMEFFATWCPHCQEFQPVLEAASQKLNQEGIVVAQSDVDKFEELANEYNVEATPTIFFFKNGQPVLKTEGAIPEEHIQDFVNQGKAA